MLLLSFQRKRLSVVGVRAANPSCNDEAVSSDSCKRCALCVGMAKDTGRLCVCARARARAWVGVWGGVCVGVWVWVGVCGWVV
jgi:hypothetical protein